MFDRLVDPQSIGTLMAEINDLSTRVRDGIETEDAEELPLEKSAATWNAKNAKDIPDEVREVLHASFPTSATKAMFSSNTKISSFVHSVQDKHFGNSQILFSKIENNSPAPGFIHHIFSLEDDERQFLAIRRLLPTTVKDPFSLYPLLGVQMFSNTVDDLEVITADDVVAQFASCSLEWENTSNVAVISLSRVSLLST